MLLILINRQIYHQTVQFSWGLCSISPSFHSFLCLFNLIALINSISSHSTHVFCSKKCSGKSTVHYATRHQTLLKESEGVNAYASLHSVSGPNKAHTDSYLLLFSLSPLYTESSTDSADQEKEEWAAHSHTEWRREIRFNLSRPLCLLHATKSSSNGNSVSNLSKHLLNKQNTNLHTNTNYAQGQLAKVSFFTPEPVFMFTQSYSSHYVDLIYM